MKIKKSEVKTQKDEILWHLQHYEIITAYEAVLEYGVLRLSDIIYQLRKDGHMILSEPCYKKNRFGRQIKFNKYIYKFGVQLSLI